MRIPQSYVQKCKVVAHVFQVLLIFIAACITIAVLTKDGSTGGATKYFFALCFLTVPALIYLVMVPMWSRAQRFANAYAFFTLDALYTIFWFAAFIAVAMWNASSIRQGAEDKKIDKDSGNCTTFANGPESKCNLSKTTVGFGVVIFLLFGLTTGISTYYLIKFRREGAMPYESTQANPHHIGGDSSQNAKDNNAWSHEIEAQDHDGHYHSDDDEDRRTEHGGNQQEDEYALLHSTETDEGRHPGRPLSWGDDHRGAVAPPYAGYADEHGGGANALSPGGYEEYRHTGLGAVDTGYKGATGGAGGAGGGRPGYSFSSNPGH